MCCSILLLILTSIVELVLVSVLLVSHCLLFILLLDTCHYDRSLFRDMMINLSLISSSYSWPDQISCDLISWLPDFSFLLLTNSLTVSKWTSLRFSGYPSKNSPEGSWVKTHFSFLITSSKGLNTLLLVLFMSSLSSLALGLLQKAHLLYGTLV